MRGNRRKLNKSQRMQLKAMICGLGLLLLIILLLGRFFNILFSRDGEREEEVHIPVIELLTNVWIMEADEEGILIYRDGNEETYAYGTAGDGNGEQSGEANGVDADSAAPYFPTEDVREQIADIELTDGAVTDIRIKTEKINGRILSADASFVEVEGYGKLPLAADYKGYRIYKSLAMCQSRDLLIGYDFADLVLEDGEICGLLMVKEEAMEYIRVLLKSADYAGLLHEQVVLTGTSDFTIQYGTSDNLMQEQHKAGDEITIGQDSGYFTADRIIITPDVLTGKTVLKSVNRSQGVPGYRGHIELLRTEKGIAVVNEVLLEEYLYCVVPSEMPASYPDEALKAQAICARTYAYGHMLKAAYPEYGAHVDDSTSYQVYNNILEQESATTAVKETYGQLLYTCDGGLAGTYYYSTSCGVGSDANVWKTEEAQAINYLSAKGINRSTMQAELGKQAESEEQKELAAQTGTVDEKSLGERLQEEKQFEDFIISKNADDFEVTEGWYRWTYQVKKLDVERICNQLKARYEANQKLILTWDGKEYVSKPIEEFQEIQELYVAKRGAGGIADELHIVTEKTTYKVITEHNIRYVLNNGDSKILRQDGSEVDCPTILPSAFFIITVGKEKDNVVGYTLSGGGFGHGVGMSQNGAKQMAKSGYTANDILLFFYDDCLVKNVYEDTQ